MNIWFKRFLRLWGITLLPASIYFGWQAYEHHKAMVQLDATISTWGLRVAEVLKKVSKLDSEVHELVKRVEENQPLHSADLYDVAMRDAQRAARNKLLQTASESPTADYGAMIEAEFLDPNKLREAERDMWRSKSDRNEFIALAGVFLLVPVFVALVYALGRYVVIPLAFWVWRGPSDPSTLRRNSKYIGLLALVIGAMAGSFLIAPERALRATLIGIVQGVGLTLIAWIVMRIKAARRRDAPRIGGPAGRI